MRLADLDSPQWLADWADDWRRYYDGRGDVREGSRHRAIYARIAQPDAVIEAVRTAGRLMQHRSARIVRIEEVAVEIADGLTESMLLIHVVGELPLGDGDDDP